MMQLGGNALICPWFRTRVQEQPLRSKADWPVYLQTWANHYPPRYEVAGFCKCSVLFCCAVLLFGLGRSNVVSMVAMVVDIRQMFSFPIYSLLYTVLSVRLITFKCLKFLVIKRYLQFSPLGPECYLSLSNLCSKRGRSEKLLINLLL